MLKSPWANQPDRAEQCSNLRPLNGNTWDELRINVREAVRRHYFDQPKKLAVSIRLHLTRDKVPAA